MAVDREGGGTDALGRQNHLLMIASRNTTGDKRILHRDGKPLSTRDRLEFLLSLPAEPLLVYDARQILRRVKPPTLRQILHPRQRKNGPCYGYWATTRSFTNKGCISRSAYRPQRSKINYSQRIMPGERSAARERIARPMFTPPLSTPICDIRDFALTVKLSRCRKGGNRRLCA